MDELELAIEWALSHDPRRFYNIFGDFYVWKTQNAFENFPQLRILYQYIEEENKIVLIDLEQRPD